MSLALFTVIIVSFGGPEKVCLTNKYIPMKENDTGLSLPVNKKKTEYLTISRHNYEA